jgi:hypothetical protein
MNKVATMLCNNIEEDKNAIETHDLKDNTEAAGDDIVFVGNGGVSSHWYDAGCSVDASVGD